MSEELQEFANIVSQKWASIPEDKIIREIIKSIKLTRSSDFEKLSGIKNDFGIYAFFINPDEPFSDVEDLIDKWNEEGFKKFPKVVKTRFKDQVCCGEGWYYLYIGKGEKLKNRVEEHLNHHATHPTYGLKLRDRKTFLANNEIEIGYWHLPEMPGVPREIKQFIITAFEKRLRNEVKPWIGKQ